MIKELSFIFSWDKFGIESIIPIDSYKELEQQNLLRLIKGEAPLKNNLDKTIFLLIMRARANPQRNYEIYAVNCHHELTEEFWKHQWESHPQQTAEVIRNHGQKLYSNREENVLIR